MEISSVVHTTLVSVFLLVDDVWLPQYENQWMLLLLRVQNCQLWLEIHHLKEDNGGGNSGTCFPAPCPPDSEEALMKCQIHHNKEWISVAEDYVEFASRSVSGVASRYGFYFDSPTTAASACAAISTTLASLDQHKPPPPPRPSSLAAPATAPATDVAPKRRRSLADFSVVEEFATTATDASSTPPALPAANSANPAAPPAIPPLPPAIPPALPAIPASDSSRPTSYENDNNISLPINVNHKMKVTFNATWSRYEGLPVEWAAYNKQFGVPLCDLPKIIVPDYEQSIPTVLVMLQRLFVSLNGPMTTGIFRLAPDKDKCQMVKEAINCGSFNGENVDVHIIANLIKVFFRDLPEGLFNSIPTDLIHQLAATPLSTLISTLYTHLPPSTHALTYYLLDLMALVVLNEHTNRMSAKNMAIVVSPNLYTVNTENPMVALTMAQKVADFTTQLLLARLELKFQYVPSSS